ncbi:hypothetical protein GCM10011375_40840 [Hymenobacter qilianensis]|uniref:Tissue inhibitor of metalloproteinase n=2 Tax=Hymenobacter qilianensis TaxID=1385715 RepID=A0A7H0H1W2_9BACT|nr:hypothetical protein [Hymenobacter qilianensis]QNP54528.1 hypothetical protein H9L05_22725 [Hymenobacter qilianensis]GGF81721.1 hypothetical protein GCM10011375_40840 [Hymenobacter qilianensis]
MLGKFFLLLLLVASFPAQACECRKSRTSWTYALMQEKLGQTPHVFLGRVFAVTDTTFQVQVLEELKGQLPRPLLQGRYDQYSSCGILVREGVWIFYSRLDAAGNLLELSACTFSGNLTEPYLLLPPPDPRVIPDSLAREQLYQAQLAEQRALFVQQWLTEYAILVAYRRQHPPAAAPTPASTWVPYLALGVALLALLIVLFNQKGQLTDKG